MYVSVHGSAVLVTPAHVTPALQVQPTSDPLEALYHSLVDAAAVEAVRYHRTCRWQRAAKPGLTGRLLETAELRLVREWKVCKVDFDTPSTHTSWGRVDGTEWRCGVVGNGGGRGELSLC